MCGHQGNSKSRLLIPKKMNDDLRTEVAWSVASKTDQLLFSMLSNSDRMDASLIPHTTLSQLNHEDLTENRVEDLTRKSWVFLKLIAANLLYLIMVRSAWEETRVSTQEGKWEFSMTEEEHLTSVERRKME